MLGTAAPPARRAAPVTDSWQERRAAREADLLASFDPRVPGLPGDGSPVVLHTDPKRGLTFTWFDVSRRPQDFALRERGYLISRLSVTQPGPDGTPIEVGYLNIAHTTPELLAAEFATPFHWADENTGASFGFRWRDVRPEQIWATAHTHLRITPPSADGTRLWAYSASDAPGDPAVLAAELKTVEGVYAKQMRRFVRWLGTPFVDYSHIDDGRHADRSLGHPGPLRGTGVGRAMYLIAAEHLATRGKVLRASGCQSEAAERLWARLAADPDVPTRRTRLTYWQPCEQQTKTYLCLDYTKSQTARA